MIPQHIQDELDKLTDEQKATFHQLLSWSGAGGTPGYNLPVSFNTYEKILDQVKRMGPSPDRPIEPDRTVNHDWAIKIK